MKQTARPSRHPIAWRMPDRVLRGLWIGVLLLAGCSDSHSPRPISATLSSVDAAPATGVVADGVQGSTITVTLLDTRGHPVAGRLVSLSVAGGAHVLSGPDSPTNAQGVATATLRSTVAGIETITATANPGSSPILLADQATVEFIADVSTISAALSSAVAAPEAGLLADGVDTSTLSVTVLDAYGNPVPGRVVALAAGGSGNVLVQPAALTDAQGRASGTLAATTAELKTVTATIDPGPSQVVVADQPLVEFVADLSNLSTVLSSAVAAPGTGVIADGVAVSTLTVTVRDANGNPAAGQVVSLAATGSNNTLVQPSAATDAAGIATGTLASTLAETKTVTVTVNPGPGALVLVDQPTVEFVGDPANLSAALSSVAAAPALGVLANGIETALLTATVRDVHGNPVAGRTVEFTATGTSNTLVQPSAVTDAFGVASGSLASTLAETKTVGALVDPGPGQLLLVDQPQVEFIADAGSISAALSSVAASPATGIVADGSATSTLTVTVLDAHGNPVPGVVVSLAASGAGNTLVQPGAPTDVGGVASGSLASTTAETKLVTATVAPGPGQVVVSQQPSVEFVGDPGTLSATLSTVAADPDFGARADGSEAVAISVVVRDANGNPLAGHVVALAASGQGNVLTQPAAPTDPGGLASGALRSTRAEAKTISAVVDPGPTAVALANTASTTFVPAAAGRRFVRATGSDNQGGTSPADAWLTLGKAASSVVPGDTVYVGAGTYPESVLLTTDGTAADRIAFVADSSGEFTGDAGEVVIDAQDASAVVTIDGADDVTLDGFTILGAVQGTGAGVRVGLSPTLRVHIRRNKIYDNGKGIEARNATDLVIEGNRISRNRRSLGDVPSGGDGVELDACSSPEIRNNLVYANEGRGIAVGGGSLGVAIRTNTLFSNEDDQVSIDGLLNVVDLRDNVVTQGLQAGIELAPGSLATTDHNLSWGNLDLDWKGLSLGVGDQSADPLLVDPDGLDNVLGGIGAADDRFQLGTAPASPAFDAGALLAALVALLGSDSLADLSTRVDGVLDGSTPDGAFTNVGFHYEASVDAPLALEGGDARVLLGTGANRQPRVWTRADAAGTWSGPALAPPSGATLLWIEHALSPLANREELAVAGWSNGASTGLKLLRGSGTAWHVDLVAPWSSVAAAHKRGLDVEYEASGDALFVGSDGTGNPRFRTRVQGEWSDDAAIFGLAPGLGAVAWVELAARAGTDEITLVYADELSGLYAVTWTGGAWDTASVATLEILLRTTESRSFDVACESLSGDVLAIWAGPLNGLEYATRAAGATAWSSASGIGGLGFTPACFDLAAEAGTNRIAMAGLEDAAAGAEPKVAVWNGSAWTDAARLEAGSGVSLGSQPGELNMAVGWVGTSGVAIALYPDNAAGTIDWGRWTSAAGWSLQSDVAIGGKGTTRSIALEACTNQDRVLALIADSNSRLFAAEYDGTAWTIANGGAALESSLSATSGAPFAISAKED